MGTVTCTAFTTNGRSSASSSSALPCPSGWNFRRWLHDISRGATAKLQDTGEALLDLFGAVVGTVGNETCSRALDEIVAIMLFDLVPPTHQPDEMALGRAQGVLAAHGSTSVTVDAAGFSSGANGRSRL
jgi:hypothetical protein